MTRRSVHVVPKTKLIGVLTIAVLAVSSSAVLVRYLGNLDALAIAWWRCIGTAILLSPAMTTMARADAQRTLLAGLCLGGHFAAWFASIKLTTIMHSTVLVCMTPVWVGLFEWYLLRRAPSRWFWPGLAVAMTGILWMTGDDHAQVTFTGDALAILGSLLATVYVLLGRMVRQRVSIGSYGAWVCAAAALGLSPVVWLQSTPLLHIESSEALILLACVLGPQLLGHNGFNYALRYLPAATVSSLLLLEPVGATLLAAVWLEELPGASAAAGGCLVVLGVFLANRSDPDEPSTKPQPETS